MEFGGVYAVFVGRFKDEFKEICNGKRHIRLTPFKSKHDLPHHIKFGQDNRFFHVMWAVKKILCIKGVTFHMLKDKYYVEQSGPAYQEDGFTIDTRLQYLCREEGTDPPNDNDIISPWVLDIRRSLRDPPDGRPLDEFW